MMEDRLANHEERGQQDGGTFSIKRATYPKTRIYRRWPSLLNRHSSKLQSQAASTFNSEDPIHAARLIDEIA